MKSSSQKRILGLVIVLYISITGIYAQSKAHEYSEFAIIDPTYSYYTKQPASNLNEFATPWIYGAAELECWRLDLLRQRKDSAKLRVGYPGVFHKPYTDGSFRLKLLNPKAVDTIRYRAVGQGSIFINGLFIDSFTASDSIQFLTLKESTVVNRIQFDIKTQNEPIALLIDNKELSTSLENWEWKAKGKTWEYAYHFPQNLPNLAPHKLENPTIELIPNSVNNNLFDFGKELLGDIIIKSSAEPIINVGESEPEALHINNKIKEQSLELVNASNGIWKTKNPLAFRYLYVEDKQIDDITCDAIFYPSSYKGAFACSDSLLTQIWMNSAYTLRLCMHDFLLDGIKRDRLPWTGDLVTSLLANAYSFSEPELVRRSIVALGRAGIQEKDINGIIDYSLWWIIAQDLYQLYYSDSLHLKHEWNRIKETLNTLSTRCNSEGFLIPTKDNWLFIDWVEQDKWTALQILWWWAQNSGSKLAQRVGDSETANYWQDSSNKLKRELVKAAWNETEQVWQSKNDSNSEITRHPNFLSIVSGITLSNQCAGIKNILENNNIKPVGTPYMAAFEVMALSQLGNTDYMLNHVKEYWGGMLEKGATTFWEAYNAKETIKEQYSFYNRPYGKSLCHAWSAGPAAFLPSELFGLKPLKDGWKHFSLNPNLGYLDWASVCLPTKFGNIIVDVEKDNIEIFIPGGTTLEWKGNSIEGPRRLIDKL